MNENNISELKPSTKQYEFLYLGKKTTLSYDDRYLYEDWKKGVAKGRSTYLLYRLSPNIVEATELNKESLKHVRTSWILLIGSIVIYFSEFNTMIPLLVPVLSISAILLFSFNIRKSWPMAWALVYDDYNYKQLGIPLPDNDDKNNVSIRETFLSNLAEAIEEAKKQEFYSGR